MKVKFIILGDPFGKQRPRSALRGQHAHMYTPKETVDYEKTVRLEYERQCGEWRFPDDMPLDMRVLAYLPIPKSTSKKKRQLMLDKKLRPIKKPDSSNIIKTIEDALNNVAYHDDTQIVDSMVRRFYGDPPRVVVTIEDAQTE